MKFAIRFAMMVGLAAPSIFAQARPVQQGPELVQRLADMSQEDREKALASLPPARRANLERRIRAFQALPATQQRLMRDRAGRINKLSPDKQAEVRAALKEFSELPADRKPVLRRELLRLAGMPDDSRAAYTATLGFRNRFSDAERKLLDVLHQIQPDEPRPLPGRGRALRR